MAIVKQKSKGKNPRVMYVAVYDLQGTPIPKELQDELESAILRVIEKRPEYAVTMKVE